MKVLDLRCAHDHRFEGWFADDADFASQRERGLLECPVCADRSVERLPSAPRLNLSHPSAPAQTVTRAEDLQSLWLRAVRHVLQNTEDVGERFAEEARRIHYGEAENRGIRGRATPEETEALAEEGIEVVPLPLPEALKNPLQ